MLTRVIAEHIMDAKGIDQSDAQVVEQIKRSLRETLRRMDDLEKVPMDGAMGWGIKGWKG